MLTLFEGSGIMNRGSTLGVVHGSYRVIRGCRVWDLGFKDITPIM